MPSAKNAIVIGGGISGLACAFRLQQQGIPVTLLEGSDRVGGLVGTVERGGHLFESGPQSFQRSDILAELVRQLGIEDRLLKADPRARRFILRNGRLQGIPMSPQGLILSSLLGPRSRWKVISEMLRRTKPPVKEESVANFVRRKFGYEILEYVVAPFVSGVYAGDPERLSLSAAFPSLDEWERKHGSVLLGAMKSRPPKRSRKGPPLLCSFRGGIATLPEAIGAKLGAQVRTNARAVSVVRNGVQLGSAYKIGSNIEGNQHTLEAGAIVFATPADAAGKLIRPISRLLGESLSEIEYAPVAVVAAAYRRQQIGQPLEGFGVLIPRREKLRTLGIVWNSSLFPGQAPDGTFVLTSFVGGATDPEIVSKTEDEIAAIVHDEAARTLGITGPPVETAAWRHSKALPQYNLGHWRIVEAIREEERKLPGLFFVGNYLDGASLAKCVEQGFRTAEDVKTYIKSSP
ncbi:MAG: protoporphyrinogen oxidase [Candidatus Acidiferrales bacterium]